MKTGIIYCPKHVGIKSIAKRWQAIAAALDKHGIEYDMIQSESAASVERLASMMIHNGYERIIIAGGDSALNDTVNALMHVESSVRKKISIGVIPNGTMNDFASFWGFDDDDLETAVESIKVGRTRKVDVGCITYEGKNSTKTTTYFLNCINIGLIALTQRMRKQVRSIVWSRKLSFLISLVLLVFQRMEYKLAYTINYERENRKVMTLCIGNALGYGQTPNAVPYNGMVDVSVITSSQLTQLFKGIWLFIRGKILNYKDAHPYRCHGMELELPANIPMTIDGRPVETSAMASTATIDIAPEAITFIIEKL